MNLTFFDDDILNPPRRLSKQQPQDPQFERTTAGALSPSLEKVRSSASTSAIQPQPSRESMSNRQRCCFIKDAFVGATTAPRTHPHQISVHFLLPRLTNLKP